MSSEYTLSLSPRTLEDAEPRAKAALESVQASLKFVPNMYRVMANAPGLLDTYLHGYALFREGSGFTPAEQEVVFLTISRDNGCEYCVAAHSFVADTMSKVPPAVTDAIRDGRLIPDEKLSALSTFASLMLETRGRPGQHDVETFLAAGYTERHILEIILAISVKTLSNYTNHLFHTPVDSVFARRAWAA
ncbi:carboxymuconolactone decarboxylase family protein [Methylolobus aquaticus]|nr:carboxymuconolactone decarboxylase family protein [Methylolobus aquaticus]